MSDILKLTQFDGELRWRCAALCGGRGSGYGGRSWFRGLAQHIDLRFDRGAFFDGKAAALQLAGEPGGGAELYALSAMNIAIEHSRKRQMFGFNGRFGMAVRTEGEAVPGQLDGAVQRAVEEEVLRARECALNANALT